MKFFLVSIPAFLLMFLPTIVFGQIGDDGTLAPGQGLVPCSGTECSACHVVVLANTIIRWFMGIVAVLFAVVAAVAGWKLVTSQGSPGALAEAKKGFTNVFIGLIIILGAWLLVDTVMLGLADYEAGSWSEVKCGEQTPSGDPVRNPIEIVEVQDESSIAGAPSLDSLAGVTPGSVGAGASVTGNLAEYQGRKFDSGVLGRVEGLHAAVPGLRLSGGHRTAERNAAVNGAKNSYHLSGRAADFVGSASEMQAGKAWANANGAREAIIHNAGSGTHLHVAW